MEHQKRSVVQLISLSHRKHPSKHKSLQPMAFGSGDPFLADEGGNMYGFLPSPVCLRTSIWSELGSAVGDLGSSAPQGSWPASTPRRASVQLAQGLSFAFTTIKYVLYV
jgi:hypothetical protein